MKNFILIVFLLLMFSSCEKQHRYTQDSEEIEIVKAAISDYNYQEWEKLMSHYNDTAHIYYNSRFNILSPTGLENFHTNHDAGFSTRAFEDENREYEMIEDNNGKIWVNFWGLWKGNLAANNKQIVIPVHITYQFVDHKIVEEYGYWNTSELLLELQKIEAKETVSDTIEKPKETEDILDVIEIEDIDNLE